MEDSKKPSTFYATDFLEYASQLNKFMQLVRRIEIDNKIPFNVKLVVSKNVCILHVSFRQAEV